MFQSSSTARHPVFSAVAGQNQHVWTYVNLILNRPWFFSTYTLHTPEGDLVENILLGSVEQVVDLFLRNGSEITISQLFLVSPKHLNESNFWRMEPLAEIWCGKPENGTTFMYRLADGRQYVDAIGTHDSPYDEDLTCVVAFDQHN